jgi:hypothetical protein
MFGVIGVILKSLADFAAYVLDDLTSAYSCDILWDWIEGAGGKEER